MCQEACLIVKGAGFVMKEAGLTARFSFGRSSAYFVSCLQDTPGDGTSFIAGSYISGFHGPDSSFFAVLSTAFNNSVL